MTVRRYGVFLALGLALSAPSGGGGALAQTIRIGKPRPAPPTLPNVPPLPPAIIDDSLAIGGQ